MKILILGGAGMLGRALIASLRDSCELSIVLRGSASTYPNGEDFRGTVIFHSIDLTVTGSVEALLVRASPDLIINCAVVRKCGASPEYIAEAIAVNSMIPHRIAACAMQIGARVIQISTDGVFSGSRGNYTEADVCDATDLYGRTKVIGELTGGNCLTLRTSLIGHSPLGGGGLLSWFLGQSDKKIIGYKNVIFSGLTTSEFARVLKMHILQRRDLFGIWNLAGPAISKYELLCCLQKKFQWKGEIVPAEVPIKNRVLDGKRFNIATGYIAPSWTDMIAVF